jgi:FAD/FMN-containing dehydrogenase/Fe-S oxidoreductase
MSKSDLGILATRISGELYTDNLHRILFSTDASVYRELPLGVVFPKNSNDIKSTIIFCNENSIPIIPRAGGTSLAGQCVGSGLVIDVSKYMVDVLGIDANSKTAIVQPGVIRDELNHILKSEKLMVGPNTSTANRAMLGGMIGNNSCGSTSIVFGNMRDHIVKLKTILSDGSEAIFEALTKTEFDLKCSLLNLEGTIYRHLKLLLNDKDLRAQVKDNYPKSSIKRRNTGYALDAIIDSEEDSGIDSKINVCKLLCGSEGTLAFTVEATIGLVDVPPANEVLVAIQFNSINESLKAVPYIMNHSPFACELMDKTILDCTKGQRLYEQDRFFIKGDPMAILLVSFVHDELNKAQGHVESLLAEIENVGFDFEYSIIHDHIERIWNLRKAGLGLLANLPGDKKAVACIEDTAVAIEDLSAYIKEFTTLMEGFGQRSVYYAHAGAGEIHLRPLLDLKQQKDRALFFKISQASARLVKKYGGSLSGEHGDGRVRAPFIKEMYGEEIYLTFCELKSVWDPKNIFNPGKIVNAKPLSDDLRFDQNHSEKEYDTVFDFSEVGGVLRAAEKCNGSGDCRKLPLSGGTMCPSYMATRNEKDTTRARANVLREILTRPKDGNAWKNEELKEVMRLCLSCKGCTSECPSNVDMSTLKAEFLHQYQKEKGVPFRSWLFANFEKLNALGASVSSISNFLTQNKFSSKVIKSLMGVHQNRTLPKINHKTLRKKFNKIREAYTHIEKIKSVVLFVDEFSNYNDASVGEKAIKLLFALGYDVKIVDHEESGRAAISKGILGHAKKCAEQNVLIFHPIIDNETPLIGIEPSAILSFKDEYPRLVDEKFRILAKQLNDHVFTIESFLYKEFQNGFIKESSFHGVSKTIHLHGHCHQKALTKIDEVAWLLSIPQNYSVKTIPSGCCGMAGSFGYEAEHFDLSMQIGELVLFPAIRSFQNETIVTSGTSCRHQILDGTGVVAYHTAEVLYDALTLNTLGNE